jgi:DNA helicase HerA-like ATPase
MYEIVVGRSPEDLKKYGTQGTGYIGKHVVGSGEEAHLTNKIMVDLVRPHVILICGKRGTGKSYSAGVVAEEISKLPDEIRKNLTVLMIDTMGIYWSMKNPNDRDSELLRQWDLKGKGMDATLFAPKGQIPDFEEAGVPWDKKFALSPTELTVEDWALAFELSLIQPLGIALERVIRKVKSEKENYDLNDIMRCIEEDTKSSTQEREALMNRFSMADAWGLFEAEGTKIEDMLLPGVISIIDVSHYAQLSEGWSVRNLLVGLLSRKVFHARLISRKKEEMELITGEEKGKIPMVWIIMDEAHQFLPNDGKTASTEPLLTLIRQGREPGISLVLITQRPNKLHEDALSQSDIVISHRLTAEQDLSALRSVMQNYLLKDIEKYIDDLPKWKGSAIILDDNSEKMYLSTIRPRFTWHAGGSPVAIKEKRFE